MGCQKHKKSLITGKTLKTPSAGRYHSDNMHQKSAATLSWQTIIDYKVKQMFKNIILNTTMKLCAINIPNLHRKILQKQKSR